MGNPVGKNMKLSEALFRNKRDSWKGNSSVYLCQIAWMEQKITSCGRQVMMQLLLCMTKKKVGLTVTTGHGLT